MPFEINKTELVWPGKYDTEGNLVQAPRVSLPFQVIERVNETRATREAKKAEGLTLFDVWDGANEGVTFEDGWRNKLIWGDNAVVMSSLLANFAGKIDLIYIDPPFDVGADFSIGIEVGDDLVVKTSSVIEEVAYRDTWGRGRDSYVSMIHSRLNLIYVAMAENSSLFVHVDWRMNSMIRILLDEIFGADGYRNEISWCYSGPSSTKVHLPRKHDSILFYAKGEPLFNQPRVAHKSGVHNTGQVFGGDASDAGGAKKTEMEQRGKALEDWWDDVFTGDRYRSEMLGYPTQKPEKLLERIIEMASKPGDLVADFFCGSGTTLAVAEKFGRRWIGADLGRFSIHTTRKRMLEIEKCKPFEVLNLGSYERQFWSTANFGKDLDGDGKINLLEYIAFILRLYGAEPLTGSSHLHGRKGDAYIHVATVSNPVTIAEIEQAVNECKTMKGSTVHVLGWEWEMGLHDPIVGEAKRLGVKLVLRQIPREVMEAEAVRKGQIKFFELAYLEVDLEQKSNGEVTCTLNDFSTPNTDFVPEEVREKIKKWSDYVDYWAIDWDFRNDTFNHGFVTYRTRQNRTLQLKSDPHKYSKAGTYKVMIKAIDIFGNDTSKLVEFKVK